MHVHWWGIGIGIVATYVIWVRLRMALALHGDRMARALARVAAVGVAVATAFVGTTLAGLVSSLTGNLALLRGYGWGAFAVILWAVLMMSLAR